ncbi:MAG: hypothetical protein CSA35_03520 [Dethiosulfovibrio peptidovorans]|nr:MAG: hypothetical protein CSA35_03520 [Dethiosulfovibrio peptidovorans]
MAPYRARPRNDQIDSGHAMTPVAVVMVVIIMGLCTTLVSLRMKGLALEARLNSVIHRAQAIDRDVTSTHKKCFALSSPSVVYGYACERLGMTETTVAGVVHVQMSLSTALEKPLDSERWRGSLPGFGISPRLKR